MKKHFKEEHELIAQSMREFIAQEITPYIEEWEKNHECPRHIFER